jgi:hypothetical protein
MPARTASALTIGVLAALACLLTALLIPVPVWVIFVAWASFFAAGGGAQGLARSVVMNLIGAAIAILCLLVITAAGGAVWSVAVSVGVGAAILVVLGAVPLLSSTPAGFLGFAATFGVFSSGTVAVTAPFSISHPVVLIVGALLLGALFGILSEKIGGLLTTKKKAA